jgi:MFS family permease
MALNRDGKFLFITRFIRLFSYGMLAVVLVLYLTGLGLSGSLLLTLTLAGDTVVSLALTTQADRFGRRRTLIAGSILMAGAGVAFALMHNFLLLVLAGTIGVISPSGNEVGPFLSLLALWMHDAVAARLGTMAENFGVQGRGAFYDRLPASFRCWFVNEPGVIRFPSHGHKNS